MKIDEKLEVDVIWIDERWKLSPAVTENENSSQHFHNVHKHVQRPFLAQNEKIQ